MSAPPIFLTGATGLIGRRLLPLLLSEGRTVHALARQPSRLSAFPGEQLLVFQGDISDPAAVRRAMGGCSEGYHLAAYVKRSGDPAEFHRSNLEGTRCVLSSARQMGLRRLLYTSSIIVYANDLSPIKDEQARILGDRFLNDYHRTKYEAHLEAARMASEGLPVILVMPSAVFGPGGNLEMNRVLNWCRRFKEGRVPHWLPDRGDLVLNLVYAGDVALGIRLAMDKGAPGEPGYILGGTNISIRELMARMATLAGDGKPFRSFPSAFLIPVAGLVEGVTRMARIRPPLTRGLVRSMRQSWHFSSRRAEKELGYTITSFEEALRVTYENC